MSGDKKRLIVIDSNAVIHRAYHALPPLTTKKGELVNAVYGFLLVFLKAVKEFQPDFIAACFDLPAPTFRHKKYREYKITRPPTPKDLVSQIPKIKEILTALNVKIFEKEGFEADDIIGTIALSAPKKNFRIETIIISGDLDNLQLVDSYTKVYALKRGVKDIVLYDEKMVRERYGGLNPQQLPDLKALKGDPSDNIPGVPGIGEKTGIKLIREFGNLENLYQKLKIPDELKKKLLEYEKQAFLSKTLSQIKLDAPIEFELEECQWRGFDEKKTADLLKNMEFYSLVKRVTERRDQNKKRNLSLF